MHRRDFLHRLALAATLPFAWQPVDGFAAAVERTVPPTGGSFAPPLDADEMQLVGALAEGILPTTDTPGARAAGVPEFIALLFSEWMFRNEQDEFRDGLRSLASEATARCGAAFANCGPERQLSLLQAWDAAAFAAPHGAPAPFFRRFKSLVVIGYYTSEVGQNEELEVQFGGGETTEIGPYPVPPPFRL